MDEYEYVVNSLLCFLNSGKNDYPYETLFEIIQSFYCFEEIKKGKEILCRILREDVSWRRDPERKKKELKDVIDLHERIIKEKIQVTFVTDSHKRMPPIGLEKLGPLLSDLSENTIKINEFLPKILDIKSEVINTADTVRVMKNDLIDLKNKFMSAVSGIGEAARDITINEVNVLEDLTSFRCVVGQPESPISRESETTTDHTAANKRTFAEVVQTSSTPTVSNGLRTNAGRERNKSRDGGHINGNMEMINGGRSVTQLINGEARTAAPDGTTIDGEIIATDERRMNTAPSSMSDMGTKPHTRTQHNSPVYRVTDNVTGAVSKDIRSTYHTGSPKAPTSTTTQRVGYSQGNDRWTHVGKRNEHKRNNKLSTVLTGQRKNESSTFKGVSKTVDIFIGRVDLNMTCDDIKEYIKDIFGINIGSVNELTIRTEEYKAFKVGVKLSERDKLFNPELWPEDVVINKFFNRSKGLQA